MAIYLLIGFIVFITSDINSNKFTYFDKFFFVILAIISGFRYQVGTDFDNYQRIIYLISQGSNTHVEWGFEVLTKIILFFRLNSQAVILSFSLLTMFFFYKGIKYYSLKITLYKPVFYLIFIMFPYFHSFNVIRQALAGAIVFYGTKYIFEKSFFKFAIFVFVAMSFHFSSIIFLPVYFFVNRSYSKKTLYAILLTTIFISANNLISKLFEIIVYDLPFLDVGGYVSRYIEASFNQKEIKYGIVFFINLLLLLLSILWKDKLITNQYKQVSFNFYYMYMIALILAGDAFAISRMQYFFSIYMAILISSFFGGFNAESRRIIKPIATTLYTLLYLYILYKGFSAESSDIIPYNFNINIF